MRVLVTAMITVCISLNWQWLQGGYTCQNHMWMHLPDLENLTFSSHKYSSNYPSISKPSFDRKAAKVSLIGCFLQINSSKTPNLYNLDSFVSMKIHQSLYQILRKSTSKSRYIYVCHVNVRTPGWWQQTFYWTLLSKWACKLNPLSIYTQAHKTDVYTSKHPQRPQDRIDVKN